MRRAEPTPLLSAADERTLARAIEAGILARHLLETGERPVPATDAELAGIVAAGDRARHHFLLANERLVWHLAGREARRSGLPTDELFQEGFVALADALQRYDADRGRFSTYAMVRIRQHLAEVASARFGELALPPSRALRLRRARGLAAVIGQERGGGLGSAELAAELGQPVECTRRLLEYRPPVALDPLTDGAAIPEAEPFDPDAGIWARQFRRLIARLDADQAQVVALRYGFVTGEPVERGAVAERLGVSSSTVRRLELRAIQVLRPLAAALHPATEESAAGTTRSQEVRGSSLRITA